MKRSRLSLSMLGLAAVTWLMLAAVHALGWRADVAFLSGTVPVTVDSLLAGLAYVGCWFAGVLVAPALVLFAALDAVWLRWRAGTWHNPAA